jgi:hypothetical protein
VDKESALFAISKGTLLVFAQLQEEDAESAK